MGIEVNTREVGYGRYEDGEMNVWSDAAEYEDGEMNVWSHAAQYEDGEMNVWTGVTQLTMRMVR